MARLSGLLLAACGAVAFVAPASATTRSFSIAPFTVSADAGNDEATGGIALPDATSTIYVNFTVPADYVLNSTMALRFYFTSANAPCGVSFGASDMARSRAGVTKLEQTNPGASMGLPGGAVSTVVLAAAETTAVKSYSIKTPVIGGFVSQKAGDGIQLSFARVGSDSGDTCPGAVDLDHVEVRYTAP